jgi:VWFA-related protein
MKIKISAIILLTFLFCFIASPLSLKSAQKEPGSKELRHEVSVTLKLVQVYVLDLQGKPVTDLEKSDFLLYDNGKLQAISAFEKHFLSDTSRLDATQPPAARKTSLLLNRKFFFLFDYERNDLEGIAKAKKVALRFIETQVQPGEEIAVLTYSGRRGFTLHEYLTADREKVQTCIKKLTEIPGVINEGIPLETMGPVMIGTEFDPQIRAAQSQVGPFPFSTQNFPRKMKDLAKALRYIPGQKNIIFFSKGFSPVTFHVGSAFYDDYQEMARELSSASSPVYAVNTATGWEKVSTGSHGGGPSLKYLSDISGGKYFEDVNYEENISREVQNLTGNYYVLGFYIDEKWDGKYHKLSVEVQRKGCRVFSPGGYYNSKPFPKLSPVEKHLQLIDLALGEQASFHQHLDFPAIAFPFSPGKEDNLLVVSRVPIQKIREEIGDKVEVSALVFDSRKNIVDAKKVELKLAAFSQDVIYLYTISSLPAGTYECRVVFRSLATGKGAVGAESLELPETSDSALQLFPPLLLQPQEPGYYLNLSPGTEKKKKKTPPSIGDIYPFNLSQNAAVVDELEQGIKQIYAAARCFSSSGKSPPKISFRAHLSEPGKNHEIPLSLDILAAKRQDGADVFLLEIRLPEVGPGDYSLIFEAEDMIAAAKARSAASLRIGTK